MAQILDYLPAANVLLVMLVLIKGMSTVAAKRRFSPNYKHTLIPQLLLIVNAMDKIKKQIKKMKTALETDEEKPKK